MNQARPSTSSLNELVELIGIDVKDILTKLVSFEQRLIQLEQAVGDPAQLTEFFNNQNP